jgi:hypothetical protein
MEIYLSQIEPNSQSTVQVEVKNVRQHYKMGDSPTKWKTALQNGRQRYKMGDSPTKWETALQNGRQRYKMGDSTTKWETALQNGRQHYKMGDSTTKHNQMRHNEPACSMLDFLFQAQRKPASTFCHKSAGHYYEGAMISP